MPFLCSDGLDHERVDMEWMSSHVPIGEISRVEGLENRKQDTKENNQASNVLHPVGKSMYENSSHEGKKVADVTVVRDLSGGVTCKRPELGPCCTSVIILNF